MAAKLSVGLQKKVGLPNYGSMGASCHVEFEVDPAWIDTDPDRFRRKVHQAYDACHQAVQERLAREKNDGFPKTDLGNSPNGESAGRETASDGRPQRRHASVATQNQIRAIFALARRQRIDPQRLASERFGVDRSEDLSIREASSLIDELKRNAPALRA
jgi:hypothetical protein